MSIEKRENIEHFNALEIAMEWAQRQDSVDRIQLLHFKRLRGNGCRKKNVLIEAENSNFFFPIITVF